MISSLINRRHESLRLQFLCQVLVRRPHQDLGLRLVPAQALLLVPPPRPAPTPHLLPRPAPGLRLVPALVLHLRPVPRRCPGLRQDPGLHLVPVLALHQALRRCPLPRQDPNLRLVPAPRRCQCQHLRRVRYRLQAQNQMSSLRLGGLLSPFPKRTRRGADV